MVRASVPVLMVACGIAMARMAFAQTPVAISGIRPIRLVLSPDGAAAAPPLSPERLRAALEAELGRSVRIGEGLSPDADALTIAYRAARQEVTVGYVPQSGTTVVRTLSAAGTVDEVAALAVLLAGNVARDQAGELLGPPPRPVAVDAQTPDQAKRPAALTAASPAPASAASPRGASVAAAREASGPIKRLHDLRIRSVVWTGNLSLINVGLSVSGQYAYALVSGSGHGERGRIMAGGGLALGARLPLRSLWLQSDVGTTYLHGLDRIFPAPEPQLGSDGMSLWLNYTNNRLVTRVRSALVFSPLHHVELFAGFAFALTTHLTSAPHNAWGPEVFAGVQL